jgi:hypothetical protein
MKSKVYSMLLVGLLAACHSVPTQFINDHQRKQTEDLERYANERGVVLQPISQLKGKDLKSATSVEEFKAAIDAQSKLMLTNQTIKVKTELKGDQEMPADVKAAFENLIKTDAKNFEQRIEKKKKFRLEHAKNVPGARPGPNPEPLGWEPLPMETIARTRRPRNAKRTILMKGTHHRNDMVAIQAALVILITARSRLVLTGEGPYM